MGAGANASGRQYDSSGRNHQEESKEEKLIILESDVGLPFVNKKTGSLD